jgi:Signal transduction histidine kinase
MGRVGKVQDEAKARGPRSWLPRPLAAGRKSRIALRIFAFNVLLVFLPVGAIYFLGSYERALVDSLEHALAQQARLTAAWIGQDSRSHGPGGAAAIDEKAAKRALAAIGDRRTARFRVVDSSGRLLADSSDVEALGLEASDAEASASEDGEPFIYKIFSIPARLWRRAFAPPAPPLPSADFYAKAGQILMGSEIQDALAGRYGAATRVSSGGQVSVTLYSAVPVLSARGAPIGAVLVSQSTYRILKDLYAIRLDIARVFLLSLAAAIALSFLLAFTIVGPIRRLSAAAAGALREGPLAMAASSFPESTRSDEIGELERSLRSFALELDERQRLTERFASDAAHEFRNPLAAIRSAAELAEGASDPADRSRFHRAIIDDADRLRAIIDGLRRLSLAEAGTIPAGSVDLAEAASTACDRVREHLAREMGSELDKAQPRLRFEVAVEGRDLRAAIDPAALDVILDNLVGNAASFARGLVRISISRKDGDTLELSVEDDGPGIPAEHLDRVFDRFFTWRPGDEGGRHTGLGLSLALALAKAAKGSLEAANRGEGGAVFRLALPPERPRRRGGR